MESRESLDGRRCRRSVGSLFELKIPDEQLDFQGKV